jgi:hypothetical protein
MGTKAKPCRNPFETRKPSRLKETARKGHDGGRQAIEILYGVNDESGYRTIWVYTSKTETDPSAIASFIHGSHAATLFPGFHTALVIRKEFITQLFENVAVNRGVMLSVFDNIENAMKMAVAGHSEGINGMILHAGNRTKDVRLK